MADRNGQRKLILVMCLLTLASPAMGQAGDRRDTEMVYRQRFAAEQFDKLMTKMDEVADLLESTDPESAGAIRQAARAARTAFVADDMAEVVRLLSGGLLSAADKQQTEVIVELKEILNILRRGSADLDKRLEQIARWRKMLKKLDKIIEREKAHQQASASATAAPEAAKMAAAAGESLKEIIAAQQVLLADTAATEPTPTLASDLAGLRDRAVDLASRQRSLAGATAELRLGLFPLAESIQREQTDDADAVGADLAKAAADEALKSNGVSDQVAKSVKAMDAARSEMASGISALADTDRVAAARAQTQAADDLEAVVESLTKALAAMTAGTPYASLADRQEMLAGCTEQVAADMAKVDEMIDPAGARASDGAAVGRAVEAMAAAASALGEQGKEAATTAEREALEALGCAEGEVAADASTAAAKAAQPDYADQKTAQDATARQTDQLVAEMNVASEIDASPTPGQSSAAQAGELMEAAGESLSGSNGPQANAAQSEAVDKLEKARRELNEAIAEAIEETQEEMLVQIEQKLRAMLVAQRKINGSVASVFTRRGSDGAYARPEQLKLRLLADHEGEQAASAVEVIGLLEADATTAVFPGVMVDVRTDMVAMQNLLAAREAGELTATLGGQIAANLADLVEAMQKEMNSRAGGGGGGGGGGGPLVPMLAELKMLRLMQRHVNRRTVSLDKIVREGKLAPELSSRQHRLLSDRQEKIQAMTQQLHEMTTAPPEEDF